ncbi:hypothetical protein BDQ17DRAFT_1435648 [Cyathus striatus]|nr:hypothetical protein BDQ17DRAFT_1435648 [Cyathus striatus]
MSHNSPSASTDDVENPDSTATSNTDPLAPISTTILTAVLIAIFLAVSIVLCFAIGAFSSVILMLIGNAVLRAHTPSLYTDNHSAAKIGALGSVLL